MKRKVLCIMLCLIITFFMTNSVVFSYDYGQNLLFNSTFDYGLNKYFISNLNGGTAEIADGYNGHNGVNLIRQGYSSNSRCLISSTPNISTYKSGDEFTLSAWIKVNEPLAEFYLGELRITTSSGVLQLVLSRTNVTVGDWVYYTNTFTAPGNGKITLFSVILYKNGSFTVSNIKLEKGSNATSWTPAPEDFTDFFLSNFDYIIDLFISLLPIIIPVCSTIVISIISFNLFKKIFYL